MKYLSTLILFIFLLAPVTKADPAAPSIAEEHLALPNALLEAAKRGEERVHSKTLNEEVKVQPLAQLKTKPIDNLDDVLLSLVDEVEALKSKVVVTARMSRATQTPKERKNVGSKTVYNFQEGSIYEIHAGVDRVTDIELGAGEFLTNPPVAGDTVRWKITNLESERSTGKATHVIVKPTEEDIETNLILTTNKNVYHLRLRASDWYMPAVRWNYPEDEARALEQAKLRRKTQERVGVTPEKLNFNYDIEGRKYSWRPTQVFDDGEKTFIKMPSNIGSSEAPALFLLDRDDTPLLVNYRVKGLFYIVDRVFARAEMRVGKTERIEIKSERDDRTFFERNF